MLLSPNRNTYLLCWGTVHFCVGRMGNITIFINIIFLYFILPILVFIIFESDIPFLLSRWIGKTIAETIMLLAVWLFWMIFILLPSLALAYYGSEALLLFFNTLPLNDISPDLYRTIFTQWLVIRTLFVIFLSWYLLIRLNEAEAPKMNMTQSLSLFLQLAAYVVIELPIVTLIFALLGINLRQSQIINILIYGLPAIIPPFYLIWRNRTLLLQVEIYRKDRSGF